MKKPTLRTTVRLRGYRPVSAFSDNKIWLDNKYLKSDKSLKVKIHSINGFGWGNDAKGAAQLALAICLELYPPDIAKAVYQDFQTRFIQPLEEDSFDVVLDLAPFNEAKVDPHFVMA
jgi:hypothetical protein